MAEENKNNKTEKVPAGPAKPYTFLMNRQPEDHRPHRQQFLRKGQLFTLLFVLLIIGVNLAKIFPLFKTDYPPVDSALMKTVSQVSLVRENINAEWVRDWYLGFPWYVFQNPLMPHLVVLLKFIFSFATLSGLVKILTAIFYLAVPVGTYFFVRSLAKKEFTALLSALIFSTPPFLLIWLPGVRGVFEEFGFISWPTYMISNQASAMSHFLALTLICFISILFLNTLRKFNFKHVFWTAVLMVVLGLANLVGLLALLIILVILLASEAVLDHPGQKIRRALLIFLTFFGLSLFWFNFANLSHLYRNTEFGGILKNLLSALPLAFVVVPILATLLFLIFDRKPKLQILFISLTWVLVFGGILAAAGFWQKNITPFPSMLLPELILGTSILIAYLFSLLILALKNFIFNKLSLERANIALIGFIVITLCLAIGIASWPYKKANSYTEGLSAEALEKTEENQVAQWLKENVTRQERVYATGRLSDILSAFAPINQVKGGGDLGYVNDLWGKAAQEIDQGVEIEKTENYLRLLGVKYLVAKTAGQETEREKWDYYYPEKFAQATFLALSKDFGAYQIYSVKLKDPSLVSVVETIAYNDLQKGDFADQLDKYAEILDAEDSEISVDWENQRSFRFKTTLKINQALVIRENYYRTWKATLDGKPMPVKKDALGFIYLIPGKEGQVEIKLRVGTDSCQVIGISLTLLTILLLIFTRTKKIKVLANNYQLAPAPKGIFVQPQKEKRFVDIMTNHEEELARVAEKAKEHYEKNEDTDWVEGTDNFTSLAAYFHRNREDLAEKLIKKFGFGDKYLDAGCGTGLLLRHLPKGSIGLDINAQNIAAARKNVPDAALVVADIENIPFPSNMFSTVICAEVLDRLPNPKLAVKEILRVLRPGGVLIGTVPRENPLWRLRFLSSRYSPEPYRFEYCRKEIEELLGPFEKIMISPALSYMTWAFVVKKKEGIF